MGLSFSCKLFETFSTAVHWIIDHKLGGSGCVHFLDDFLFVGPANSPLCLQTLEMFLTMSKQIGLPIKADKTVFPTTTLTFLGLDLDSELMEIRLPLDKLGKLKDQFNHFKLKKKIHIERTTVINRPIKLCMFSGPSRSCNFKATYRPYHWLIKTSPSSPP